MTSARVKEDAIQHAEAIRDMKQTQDQGNVPAFQSAWAKVKFGQAPNKTQ